MKKIISLYLLILCTYIGICQSNSYGNISYSKATNISGKQRMLSQRITKLYMLKLAGSHGTELTKEFNSSIQLFERNLSILESNGKSSSMKIKSSLRKEKSQWERFKQVLREHSISKVNSVMTNCNELLKRCHELVLAIEEESKYSNEFANESASEQLKVETVNISGKQRMLSQRLCLYYTACRVYRKERLDSKALCNKVEEIYAEMNKSLNWLLINDLNTFAIEENIGKILGLFEEIEKNKKDFKNNKLPLVKIMNLTNKITSNYNVVTGQYTSL